MMGTTSDLTKSAARDLVSSVDTFLIDCDGVIWCGNEAVEGAQEAIAQLRKQGKRVFFVTNNSTKSRRQYVQKFYKLGIQASVEEVISTAYVAAQYLTDNVGYHGKVYLLGGEGLKEEFDEAKIPYIGPGPDLILTDGYLVEDWLRIELDPDIQAVVAGFDEHFNYLKMMKAASYLFNPNCIFIGTNEDAFLPVPKGHITIPGTGCLVAAVAMAAQRSPIYIGKPHKPMFELLQKKHGLDPGRTCMIGDSLKSDIRFGFNNNLLTLLVLSGATKKEQFNELQKRSAEGFSGDMIMPHYFCDSIASLIS